MNCKFYDDFIALDQILIRAILLDVLLIVLIINCLDHRDLDQDEEKFQREILSDEPNLIKLYLQVPHKFEIFWHSHVRWILIELFASGHGSEFSFVCGLRCTSPPPKNAKLIHINWSAYGLRWFLSDLKVDTLYLKNHCFCIPAKRRPKQLEWNFKVRLLRLQRNKSWRRCFRQRGGTRQSSSAEKQGDWA